MIKKGYAVVICFLLSFVAFSQTKYGNEWIDPNSTYFKIKIARDGLYRLDSALLASKGVVVNTISPFTFRLFKNGKEVKIYIKGEDDGRLNTNDYIEFYGEQNKGELDSALYKPTSNAQPHKYYSLFSDTANYYLTWGFLAGLRVTQFNGAAFVPGSVPEPWYLHEELQVSTNRYFFGEPVAESATPSEYTANEGWASSVYSMGNQYNKNVSTSGYVLSGPPVIAEVMLNGVSNGSTAFPPNNHHLKVFVGKTNTTFNQYKDTMYTGYKRMAFSFPVSSADIGSNICVFRFKIENDLGASADNSVLNYIKLTYPRSFSFATSTSRILNIKGPTTQPNTYLKINGYGVVGKRSPIVYDLTNNIRIVGLMQNDSFKVLIPNSGTNKTMLIADSTDVEYITQIERVSFFPFQSQSFLGNYVIVSHPSLKIGAEQYAAYRQSPAGGNFKTTLAYVNQIYETFYYGIPHPLAIRNFSKYVLDNASTKPEYLLLLGKGYHANLLRDSLTYTLNLVPSFGVPSSDILFTAGLDTGKYAPAIATGRVAARTNADVMAYLGKVMTTESAQREMWQKDILHVTGAKEQWEFGVFTQYLNKWASIIRKPAFGAKVTNIDKLVTQVTTVDAKGDIIKNINNGVALYSYFGHGSALVLSVDMGMPSEYSNTGKYPVMMFSGCTVGDCFTNQSLGEFFMFEPNKGASAWIAGSNLAYPIYLGQYGNYLYNNLSKDMYGARLGDIVKRTLYQFQNVNNGINLLHVEQIIFQGDPALKLYNFQKPDYEIKKENIFVAPDNVHALSDSFSVTAFIRNAGRATTDSISVTLKRTMPDNSIVTYPEKRILAPFYQDTITFWAKSKSLLTRGLNRFTISLDTKNEVNEIDETNNTATLDFYMPSNGINLLYPYKYGIVPKDTVVLLAQSSDFQLQTIGYRFEIDTVPTFSSLWKQSFYTQPTTTLAEATFRLLPTDSAVYYWRARLDVPVNEGGQWDESSFTYMKNSPPGWSQGTYFQRKNATFDNMEFDSTANLYKFQPTVSRIKVKTKRWSTSLMGVFQDNNGLNPSICTNDRFVLVAFDTLTLRPISYYYPCRNGYYTYKAFDMQTDSGRTSFKNFVTDSIPSGIPVAMFNRLNSKINLWRGDMLIGLSKLGVDTNQIKTITNDSTSFVAVGKKGFTPGQAVQSQYYNPSPLTDSTISVDMDLKSRWYQGEMSSELIGPANSWGSLTYNFTNPVKVEGDSLRLKVFGVTSSKTEVLLDSSILTRTTPYSLSNIDAKVYPFLRLKSFSYDSIWRTAPNISRWTVTHNTVPEGTIYIDNTFKFYSDSLPEGDSLFYAVKYRNISNQPMDSLLVETRMTFPDLTSKVDSLMYPPLLPGMDVIISRKRPTIGLGGKNEVQIVANPGRLQPEVYLYNNLFRRSFRVSADRVHPTLNVTFDGKHIFNGDIVSPSPSVLIVSKDNNLLLLQNDTTGFKISVRKPGNINLQRLWFAKGDLRFTPADNTNRATVEWLPKKLDDGQYDLVVESKDKSGNASGTQPFSVTFEVINEKSVSNVYPYPNPFSNKTRFVFTLTGDELPQNMRISIYTITGRVVKEITQEELGPIHVGNNITEFAWDGTDKYGDKLANGVYLYRVFMGKNGSQFKSYSTEGDKYFSKGFGKIYIMR